MSPNVRTNKPCWYEPEFSYLCWSYNICAVINSVQSSRFKLSSHQGLSSNERLPINVQHTSLGVVWVEPFTRSSVAITNDFLNWLLLSLIALLKALLVPVWFLGCWVAWLVFFTLVLKNWMLTVSSVVGCYEGDNCCNCSRWCVSECVDLTCLVILCQKVW